jgi:steroid delta-isomerase-like uncharacterized protein
MSTEENKALSRRLIEEVWNQGKLAVIDELVAPNYVDHDPTGPIHGPEGFKQFVSMYLTAYPDTHFTIEDQIAEGDTVVTRWTARGTHKGPLMGIPPTGKQVTVTGISIGRVVNGKTVEGWSNYDTLGMMQQLGVVPAPGQPG